MKIGIVTYHRGYNYGALLQAIASRYVLEKKGVKAYYVDYWPEYHRQAYAFFSFRRLFSKGFVNGCGYLKGFLKSFRNRWKKVKKSELFISKYITPYSKPVTEEYDAILYGSDQIWRKQKSLKDYNPVYFGKNKFKAKRHIAFSASMGILPNNTSERNKIKELVSSLDAISVREADLQQMLLQFGLSDVCLTPDPTLLLKASEWDDILKLREKQDTDDYVLFYNLMSKSFDRNQIKEFASHHNLKLKILTGTGLKNKRGEIELITDPRDFVSLIKNASFVFTSSFHGLAFSILYGKPVYASFAKNQGRAESLLNSLNMSSCLLRPLSQIPKEYPSIDYNLAFRKLDDLKNDMERFIANYIISV